MIALILAFTFGFALAIAMAYFNMLQGFNRYKQEAKEKLEFYSKQHSIAKMKYEQMKAMSHHLLTPLHGIRGSADNLSGTQLNEKQIDMVKDISKLANEIFSYLRGVCQFVANEETREDDKEIKEFPSAKILLAEDDPINQKIAKSYLEKAGVVPDIANTGKEALEMVQKKSYDIVIMDLSMPDMDGIEATRTIRQRPQIPKSLVIIGFTANSSDDCREACLFAGMNDYMTKPATAQQILSTLQKWLPESAIKDDRCSRGSKVSLEECISNLEKALEQQNYETILESSQHLASFCREHDMNDILEKARVLQSVGERKEMTGGLQTFFEIKHSLQFISQLSKKSSAAA